jgi:hypothetical protein
MEMSRDFANFRASRPIPRQRLLSPLLNIDLQRPKRLLMPGDRMAKGIRQSFCREEVHDNPLRELNRLRCCAADLLVEAEVHDQFFRRPSYSAKILIGAGDMGFVNGSGNEFKVSNASESRASRSAIDANAVASRHSQFRYFGELSNDAVPV